MPEPCPRYDQSPAACPSPWNLQKTRCSCDRRCVPAHRYRPQHSRVPTHRTLHWVCRTGQDRDSLPGRADIHLRCWAERWVQYAACIRCALLRCNNPPVHRGSASEWGLQGQHSNPDPHTHGTLRSHRPSCIFWSGRSPGEKTVHPCLSTPLLFLSKKTISLHSAFIYAGNRFVFSFQSSQDQRPASMPTYYAAAMSPALHSRATALEYRHCHKDQQNHKNQMPSLYRHCRRPL